MGKKIYGLVFVSVVILASLNSCNKQRLWETKVIGVDSVNYNEVHLLVEYELPRNDNYVYCGICISETENPTKADMYELNEYQNLNSDEEIFYIEGLYSGKQYHVRSYIEPNGSDNETIYSENFTFTTSDLPDPPCSPTPGLVSFGGSNQSMTDLTSNTVGDGFTMSTTCSMGDVDFVFSSEPSTGIYSTVTSTTWLAAFEVHISGTLGIGWSCYYGASSPEGIYVNNDGNGNISITFCDLVFSTSMSCTPTIDAIGEVHN